jgi:hypothetical protein
MRLALAESFFTNETQLISVYLIFKESQTASLRYFSLPKASQGSFLVLVCHGKVDFLCF